MLFLTSVLAYAHAEKVKTYVCNGFYSCDKCCEHLGAGCKMFGKATIWFGMYNDICSCSCPDDVVPNLGDSITELKYKQS